ncbi:MAG: class I tRNA ligase family protein, partial [Nanoarchaeota archaeon]|nr:class I tRNA ligase family protein [Nanoarchaeota archaeon]
YKEYNFHKPVADIKHFIWETFSSHYLELVKNRAYNQEEKYSKEEQEGAIFTLNKCLDIILKLLAPVLPMLAHKLYLELKNKDIHNEKFPEKENFESKLNTEALTELNSSIWKAKKDKGLSLKSEIRKLVLLDSFKEIEKDLIAAHNIKKISFGKKLEINL